MHTAFIMRAMKVYYNGTHSAISQKAVIFILTAVRT
jgi:hypothetical protein